MGFIAISTHQVKQVVNIKSQIFFNHALCNGTIAFDANVHALPGCELDVHHLDLGHSGLRGKSELFWLYQSKVILECSYCVLQNVTKIALVSGSLRYVILVIVSDSTCD